MTAVQRLFEDYVREHRSGGEADPRAFLRRAPAGDRRELEALIDAYLARSPRQEFDAGRFRGSSAERTVDALERVLGGQSGLWPALLPRLRHRAGLRRSHLVEQLAAALGVPDRAAKVGVYYHRMEQGTLPSSGVSMRVLQALGALLGESAHELSRAGQQRRGPEAGQAAAAASFARLAYGEHEGPTSPTADPSSQPTEEWDEVDRLFCAG
ncbi:MAG TPA: hypothetical protein VKV27_05740 [Solirubrobacteraceae bacterium]|nr:hypothetical protein [Solirubrobacteraceae bacterium]